MADSSAALPFSGTGPHQVIPPKSSSGHKTSGFVQPSSYLMQQTSQWSMGARSERQVDIEEKAALVSSSFASNHLHTANRPAAPRDIPPPPVLDIAL